MKGKVLMVQGTSSDAGKSFLVAALLRWCRRRGLAVAPFKAQNMARNAAVTAEGKEIGRAQADQAEAAGVAPHVDMNPILLKPEGGFTSQVVVLGRSMGAMSWRDYGAMKASLRSVVLDALERLRLRHELVIVEGAGSPAEINLRDGDLVNMFIARSVQAPVWLVADIDRGGAFASLFGTWSLLPAEEQALIRRFVLNRVRGDVRLLESGCHELERRTGVPVLGAIPYLADFGGPAEDSLALADRRHRPRAPFGQVEVTVVDLPHISNYDEFRHLEQWVTVRYSTSPRDGAGSDLVIVPGSKCTVDDLRWVERTGWGQALALRCERDQPVLGICGGCQILGRRITEDGVVHQGLGLLPVSTQFSEDKRTTQVRARIVAPWALRADASPVDGYEIHRGRLEREGNVAPFAKLDTPEGLRLDGAGNGPVAGTMVHGLFEHSALARALLAWAAPAGALLGELVPLPDPHERAADALDGLHLEEVFERELGIDVSRSSR
ncbi:MAG: cobyric acid synthase [Myxococcota bacterium]